MSSAPQGEDEGSEALLIERVAAGEVWAFDELLGRCYVEMLRKATAEFRRRCADPVVYTAEGRAHDAMMRLRRHAEHGKLGWVKARGDFLRAFESALGGSLAQASDHQAAIKRGGTGRHRSGQKRKEPEPEIEEPEHGRSFKRREVDLDRQAQDAAPLDEVEAGLDLEALLEHLDDPMLRQILGSARAGESNREIARKLKVAPASIDRALQRIRRIWEKINRDQT
jgi:hypothetical protein